MYFFEFYFLPLKPKKIQNQWTNKIKISEDVYVAVNEQVVYYFDLVNNYLIRKNNNKTRTRGELKSLISEIISRPYT